VALDPRVFCALRMRATGDASGAAPGQRDMMALRASHSLSCQLRAAGRLQTWTMAKQTTRPAEL
jgi:hypothetical protein